ncbi:MAG TPA: 4Fe-4S binding protein [Candidatus Paceibacterota bacterium]|nr:4Fe-4S binding protein [Verrucomicrobiota bacterium]HRY47152.1 4Fe-4S binding protein [Candidatus Paceibacterota bacterium]
MNSQPSCPERSSSSDLGRMLKGFRPWVQTAFLAVWLAPVGRWLHGVPACVFHCYACPLSAFGCPVGLAANYAATLPTWNTVPWMLLGVLVLTGGLAGSLVCGWSCPFGFLQDLLGRISRRKIQLPGWVGNLRYLVLIGLVLWLPWYWGRQGILFDDQVISICRLCPAGALESGLYYSVKSVLAGQGWIMSWYKLFILGLFLIGAVFVHRPWCRIFCPLGGFLALFNRFSLFHLRFDRDACVECNLCQGRCPAGVKLDLKANASNCIRCLECATCGALVPSVGRPEAHPTSGSTER